MNKSLSFKKLLENFTNLLNSYGDIEYGRKLNPVDAFFAYRILLGRNPHVDSELPYLLSDNETYREFISRLLNSDEFKKVAMFMPPNKELMIKLNDFRFWFNTCDKEMGVQMALGNYEPKSVELLIKTIKPGMKCIDAGAQTGFFTCIMAHYVGGTGKVYAFEPMPSNYDLLIKNITENNFQDRVQPFQLACSNSQSVIIASKVANMYVAGEVEAGEKVTMESVRVDDIIDEPIDIIKIDIEGHEPAGIEGMRTLILENKPIIFSEVNEYWLRTCSNSNSKEYVELLSSIGYEIYNVENLNSPVTARSLKMDILDTMDIVALPAGSSLKNILNK